MSKTKKVKQEKVYWVCWNEELEEWYIQELDVIKENKASYKIFNPNIGREKNYKKEYFYKTYQDAVEEALELSEEKMEEAELVVADWQCKIEQWEEELKTI